MGSKALVVQLKGGLGNQMFQYAAGRALAARNDAQLYVDAVSGFARDKVYRRAFELDALPVATLYAGWMKQAPYWLEKLRDRVIRRSEGTIRKRPWGTLIHESSLVFQEQIIDFSDFRTAWMEGYWQCERYFEDARGLISSELAPPAPKDSRFLDVAHKIDSCNAVAVGVRLFEEVPGASKAGVGGVVPAAFYTQAARRLAQHLPDPVFFVFCTTKSPVVEDLQLPGETLFVTHDNGFEGTLARLWLISRCHHHVLSNSSFYWWGAWLAEQQYADARIIAADTFVNKDCVPARWRVPQALYTSGVDGAVLRALVT